MEEWTEEIKRTASLYKSHRAKLSQKKVLVGFDGFVDEIIYAVDKRLSPTEYERVETLKAFGERVASASGKSANVELVPILEKVGGNGPLMSSALSEQGAQVTCVGLLGYPQILPVFNQLAQKVKLISVGQPGHTDAVEFLDGKLMMGKLSTIRQMNWQQIQKVIGEETFWRLLEESQLIACTNWTMLSELGEILDQIASTKTTDRNQICFFDLADPEKRTAADIFGVLLQIQNINVPFKSVLGLNLREAEQLAELLELPKKMGSEPEFLLDLCTSIRQALNITGVVIHALEFAAAHLDSEKAWVKGPYCQKPKLTTGGGDHFNGGFCAGLLMDMPLKNALCLAVATSGLYVRQGQSPNSFQLEEFFQNWSLESQKA